MSDPRARESDARQQLVERLRKEGYSVEIEPDLRAEGVGRPDIVARRGSETVVVEIKALGTVSGGSKTLAQMARAVQQRPGWRFAVAIISDQGVQLHDVLTAEEVEQEIAQARAVPHDTTGATLVAWAVFEAATRAALVRDGIAPPVATSRELIQLLASQGLISPVEERTLHEFAAIRNRLAHGMRATPTGANVGVVLEIAERLIRPLISTPRRSPHRSRR